MRSLREIMSYAFGNSSDGLDRLAAFDPQPSPVMPPKPDDLAIAFGAALLSTGRYETPGGAIAAAWCAVPEFYMSRDMYAREIAPMFFMSTASPPLPTEDAANDEPEYTVQAARI